MTGRPIDFALAILDRGTRHGSADCSVVLEHITNSG